jgi:hypothetical protein
MGNAAMPTTPKFLKRLAQDLPYLILTHLVRSDMRQARLRINVKPQRHELMFVNCHKKSKKYKGSRQ